MALAVTGAHSVYNNATAVGTTLAFPAGSSVGEMLIAVFSGSDSVAGAALTLPVGWTNLRAHSTVGSSSSWVGWKLREVSDTNWTWTMAASRKVHVGMISISGAHAVPIDASAVAGRPGSQATTDAPSVTTLGPSRLNVVIFNEKSSTATTCGVAPADSTTRVNAFGTGASTVSLYIGTKAIPVAGATGIRTATYDSVATASAMGMQLAIIPAGGIGSPGTTEVDELNRLANGGVSYPSKALYKGFNAAANAWAGTSGLTAVGALNVKAGNTFPVYRDFQGVCNQLAGTTGLGAPEALRRITS